MKLELNAGSQFLGRMAIKHQVSMTGYPLSYWKDKKHLYLMAAGLIFGKEKNKKALIKDIKKQPEGIEIEIKTISQLL